MSDQAGLLQAVDEVARRAGGVALAAFRKNPAVEWKADGSPVTAADRAAEQAAREWISKRFPSDGILGEEMGHHNPDAERRWIVDPIDGTTSFIRGVPLWGTLVAVARGEQVLAGAIFCPAVDEMVCAATGAGCWWNGVRARVSGTAELSRAVVLTTDERFVGHDQRRAGWRALAARSGGARGWSDCFGYLLVATGRAEAMADPVMSVWDSAALMPVIEEAGGVFTDWDGRATAFGGSAIASNAALAGEVRAVIAAGMAGAST